MPNGLGPLEEYAAALTRERAAWDAVRASLPGSSGFNQELWQRWRQAMDAADQAAERAKAAAAPPQVPRPGWSRLVASFRACGARPSRLA